VRSVVPLRSSTYAVKPNGQRPLEGAVSARPSSGAYLSASPAASPSAAVPQGSPQRCPAPAGSAVAAD
jgi:hypothetical protein